MALNMKLQYILRKEVSTEKANDLGWGVCVCADKSKFLQRVFRLQATKGLIFLVVQMPPLVEL
jgi:hypothetical protein